MSDRLTARLGRALKIARNRFTQSEVSRPRDNQPGLSGIWIDVGAYVGDSTFKFAKENPALHVYAFEPNLKLAVQCWGLLPNFTVFPVAVAETDGFSDLYINANVGASSLLDFNPEGLRRWIGGQVLKVESKVRVPTTRLDTFMKAAGISRIEYLKIDAQGADLSVIKSAGERIRNIKKIMLEVATTPVSLYEGAASRTDVVNYLQSFGFALTDVEAQTHGQEENLTFLSENAI